MLAARSLVRLVVPWLLLCGAAGAAVGGETPAPAGMVAEVLGSSALGQPIIGYRWRASTGDAVLIIGAVHGDERESGELADELLRRWQSAATMRPTRHVLLIPRINPDGWAQATRKNANGVDLNRNFPFQWRTSPRRSATHGGPKPLSEPEARIMHELVEREPFAAIITLHSCRRCGGMNNYDGPARRLAEHLRRHNEYAVTGEWPEPTPGSFGTFAGQHRKIPTLTLEMPRGMAEQGMAKNIAALEALLEAATAP